MLKVITMNTSNKVLIYDKDCPLCSVYTSAFVSTGMLSKAGRKNFDNVGQDVFKMVDQTKCNNGIPLVDLDTKTVLYGVDAILELLNEKFPLAKKAGNIWFIKWFLVRLYKFISYNRKVIVAIKPKNAYNSNPDFNVPYRLCFMATFLVFNSWMLYPLYNNIFSQSFVGNTSFAQFQYAHLLFVTINILGASVPGRQVGLEYLGQINMLALITVLLMTPLLSMIHFTGIVNRDFNHFYLGGTTVVVIHEYIRRMKYASIIQDFPALVVVNIICLALFLLYLVY